MGFIKYTSGLAKVVSFDEPMYFECVCRSDEHTIKAYLDHEDNQVHFFVGLNSMGFFKRLVAGIKYIFGYECKYGHYDDFIFKSRDAEAFRVLLSKIIT